MTSLTNDIDLSISVTSIGFANISKCFFICSGWGLTENGKVSEVLLKVNLKVSDDQKAGFLSAFGGVEGYGICKVI